MLSFIDYVDYEWVLAFLAIPEEEDTKEKETN